MRALALFAVALVPLVGLACGRTTSAPSSACQPADGGCVEEDAAPADMDASEETGMSSATCAAMTDAATIAIAQAVAAVSIACDADSDCILVNVAAQCTLSPCGVALVSQSSAAALEQAVDQIAATDCAGFYEDGGCPPLLSYPCPPVLPPVCVAGSCGFGNTYPGEDAGNQNAADASLDAGRD